MSLYQVYVKRPGPGRFVRMRDEPTDWATAVADYRRPRENNLVVAMFEVTESGERIRRVRKSEIDKDQT